MDDGDWEYSHANAKSTSESELLRPDLSVLPSPAPSDEPSPQQFITQESVMNDGNHIVNQNIPQGTPHDGQPPLSPSMEQTVQIIPAPTVGDPQDLLNMQTERPKVKQVRQYKRQMTTQTQSPLPSLATRIPLIEQHIHDSGGFDVLDAAVERPRFLLLIDACQREDFFFVALHQLFCLWAVNQSQVLQVEGFRSLKTIENAFHLITKLIRGNEGLAPLHSMWFAEFPSPLSHLLDRSDGYRRILSAVSYFLGRLATEKSDIIQQCLQRGYPPLVDEMVQRLGLHSPVLQGIFFTASRRTLGVRDDTGGPEIERLFLQDREAHERLAARMNTNFPPSENEIRERNVTLAEQYFLICNAQSRPQKRLQSMTADQPGNASGSGSFVNSAQTSNAQQPSHGIGTILQSRTPAGSIQIPQATMVSLPADSVAAPTLQVDYQAPHPVTCVPTVPSSNLPSQLLPEQGYVTQTPQPQMRHGFSQMSQPVLGSNHNQVPLNHAPSNIYPGPSMVAPMQPNVSSQQTFVVPAQQPVVPCHNYPHQHFQSQQTRQRHASAAVAEPSAQIIRRVNSVPALGPLTQSPVHRSQNTNPPTVRSTVPEGPRRSSTVRQAPAQGPWQIPLIPRSGQSLPNHAPNPELTAIHQSGLRSPYLVPVDKPLDLAHDDSVGRYYQAVVDFAVAPVGLPHDRPLRIENFIIPIDTYARVPKDIVTAGAPPIRHIQRGSFQYRMRCIQTRRDEPIRPADFVVRDTVWPATFFLELNNVPLELRRKLHYGRDLPVDVTAYVQSISNNIINQVRLSVPRTPGFNDDIDYYFAVEIVEILQHQQIVAMCLDHRIPAETTLQSIKNSLSGSFMDNDEDEISMVVGDLTINLADPFMARIFDIPVRGSSCLHRECFDLQTFLTTRNSKFRVPKQPCMVDVWRCPLCGKDARPYSLRVDDFLVSVRETLAKSDELHTKSIVVSADGTWKPKPEVLPSKRSASRAGLDEDDMYASDDNGIKKSETPRLKKLVDIEVIELDD